MHTRLELTNILIYIMCVNISLIFMIRYSIVRLPVSLLSAAVSTWTVMPHCLTVIIPLERKAAAFTTPSLLSLGLQSTLLRANLTETTNAATSGLNPTDPGQDTNVEGLSAAKRSVIAYANNIIPLTSCSSCATCRTSGRIVSIPQNTNSSSVRPVSVMRESEATLLINRSEGANTSGSKLNIGNDRWLTWRLSQPPDDLCGETSSGRNVLLPIHVTGLARVLYLALNFTFISKRLRSCLTHKFNFSCILLV